ncbi:GAF domain-containing protein [Alkalihalobacillus sp. 1P02AB]|uniref:GAF domain-containing protein n=1 Tax=Alkalihalobacillus sp. 1P02AB TaxID=3132260 RepID=UPI0039A47B81
MLEENSQSHNALVTVSKKLFQLISDRLNVNTTYVTRKDEHAMMVLSSFNKEELIIPEGYQVQYGDTYCRLIIQNKDDVMTTNNLATFNLTRELEVTEQLKVKGFLGVTLRDIYGNVFGTLCVMDKAERSFSNEEIHFLKNMADILSFLIHLDETSRDLEMISCPIIPIKQGLAILSLQGNINEVRSQKILEDTLSYAAEFRIHHFIIDLSQLFLSENQFPDVLKKLVMALNIMGSEVFIAGVPKWLVSRGEVRAQLEGLNAVYVKTVEEALNSIGYSLNRIEK